MWNRKLSQGDKKAKDRYRTQLGLARACIIERTSFFPKVTHFYSNKHTTLSQCYTSYLLDSPKVKYNPLPWTTMDGKFIFRENKINSTLAFYINSSELLITISVTLKEGSFFQKLHVKNLFSKKHWFSLAKWFIYPTSDTMISVF